MFADPEKNLKLFDLREDMIVADLGAGTGFYSMLLSEMLPRGKVYAVEIQRDFLMTIIDKIAEKKCTNIECLWGDIEKHKGTKLADGILDAVVASNVLFLVENKENFIKEIKRVLKPKGRVLLIDWSADSSLLHKEHSGGIPKHKALEMFKEHGFNLEKEIDTGIHHYGMILTKK
ncbi:MAG: class I SAM-dependent methyltransferase [Patescibacteria group bacterium]